MESFQSVLDKMGSNFLVAALVPSLAFISLAFFVFAPLLPVDLVQRLAGASIPLIQVGIAALTAAVALGFTLTSLNTFLIKTFEGYLLVWRVPWIKQGEMRKYRKIIARKNQIKRRIRVLKKIQGDISKTKIKTLKNKLIELEKASQKQFPQNEDEVLPFRFGNILRAAEGYPMVHYNIDSISFWPRLIHVIPNSYGQKIDQSHNQLSFLINCAVLSWIFAGFCVFAVSDQLILAYWIKNNIHWPIQFFRIISQSDWLQYIQSASVLTGIFVLANLMAIIFYRASLLSVGEYGEMIRSAYDLFRFDLLQQLHLPLPKTSGSELDDWDKLRRLTDVAYAIEDIVPQFNLDFEHNPHIKPHQTPQNIPEDFGRDTPP